MIRLNGEIVNTTLFPDNTSQVWKLPLDSLHKEHTTVEWEYTYEGEFMQLAQLKVLLDTYGVSPKLSIPYLPYARQDKEISNDTTFALHVFAELLNNLRFTEVQLLDPHSHVALDLIRNSVARYPSREVVAAIYKSAADIVCYPDKGALDKYSSVYPWIKKYGFAEKVRDQATGKILGCRLVDPERFREKIVLIVDDICDGGATFINLAHALKQAGAISVDLFVTHGIFSKGLKPIKQAYIDRVYTRKGSAYEDHNGYICHTPFREEELCIAHQA